MPSAEHFAKRRKVSADGVACSRGLQYTLDCQGSVVFSRASPATGDGALLTRALTGLKIGREREKPIYDHVTNKHI